jgi:hypothetical protein
MRARIDVSRNRVWLERGLAGAAAVSVSAILLDHLRLGPIDAFTLFPAVLGTSVWWPLLARRRWSAVGEVEIDDRWLIVRTRRRRRRIPLAQIRGVRARAGSRGASVAFTLADGTVGTLEMDDRAEAEALAAEMARHVKVDDFLAIPTARWTRALHVVRVVASLFALAYYLHEVADVIGGDKAFYGLTALGAAAALLVLHFLRQTSAWIVPSTELKVGWASVGDHPERMMNQLRAHCDAVEVRGPEPARLAEAGESRVDLLARLRADLVKGDAYRGASASVRERLEAAVRTPATPLVDRALALRVLADGAAPEARRRIAEAGPALAPEPEWLEGVALAEDDAAALERIARRIPRFEP